MIFNILNKAKEIFYSNKTSGLKATDVQDAIDELNSSFEWKKLTLPAPVVNGNTRTYNMDLSAYKEIEVQIGITAYGVFNTYRGVISDKMYPAFYDEYTDGNNYLWAGAISISQNAIAVTTSSKSTNPSTYPLNVRVAMVR